MAVSINWGPFVGVLTINTLQLGVDIRAPDFWKSPYLQDRLTTKKAISLNTVGVQMETNAGDLSSSEVAPKHMYRL